MTIAILTSLIGLYIMLSRYNIVGYIIGLEMILLGANMNFVFAAPLLSGLGIMVNLVLLIIAAIETTIGLSLILNLHRLSSSIELPITGLKG